MNFISVLILSEFLIICPTAFTIMNPRANPTTVDANKPIITFSHSNKLMQVSDFVRAVAAPDTEATRAWLSLVGIPKNHAVTAHKIIDKSDAHNARVTVFLSQSKVAMFVIEATTFPFKRDIIKTPKKFITAARITAFFGVNVRDETHVAIAVGASVQPFTIITPEMSTNKKIVSGSFDIECNTENRCKNYQPSKSSACILPLAVSKGILSDPLKPVSSLQISSFSERMSARIALSLSEKD